MLRGVSAQLEQILGYLDRDGVTEIVISVGRPIAMRKDGAFASLTAKPLSLPQVEALIQGSPLEPLVPARDGSAPVTDVDIGRRRVRVQAGRRGQEIVLKIESLGVSRAPTPTPVAATPVVARAPTPVPVRAATPAPVAPKPPPPAPLMGDFEPAPEELTFELEDHPRGAKSDSKPIASKPLTPTPVP